MTSQDFKNFDPSPLSFTNALVLSSQKPSSLAQDRGVIYGRPLMALETDLKIMK